MPITQILLTAASSGGGGPTPSGVYPPTLTAVSGSLSFYASNSYLSINDNQADWAVGTGDYTVEWQQWMLSNTSNVCRMFSVGNWPNATFGFSLEGGTAYLWAEGSGVNNQVGNFNYNSADLLNDWVHVAISRESGWTRIFFNGVLQWTTNGAYDVITEAPLFIGNQSDGIAPFQGYIKDFRITKGRSVYSTDFAPPIESLPAEPDTTLLLSVYDPGIAFDDSLSRHLVGYMNYTNVVYAEIGPYALTLLVDANNINSFDFNVSTTNWNDLSSQDHDVTVANMTWEDISTPAAYKVANFSTNGYGTANSGTIAPQDGITPRISVSFWANISAISNYQHIAGYRGENKFHVLLLPNNINLECRIETNTGYWDLLPNISSTINVMAHYAFVANGDRVDFYVNGVATGGTTYISGNFTGTLGDFNLANVGGGFQADNLRVGYARVDNRARSPGEILREYNATKSVYGY